jgi:hypothetical protein
MCGQGPNQKGRRQDMGKRVETSGTVATEAPDVVADVVADVAPDVVADVVADVAPDVVAGEPAATHRITALPAAGFWRAGRQWHREAEAVRREDFTGEQWAALVGEPMLAVVAL